MVWDFCGCIVHWKWLGRWLLSSRFHHRSIMHLSDWAPTRTHLLRSDCGVFPFQFCRAVLFVLVTICICVEMSMYGKGWTLSQVRQYHQRSSAAILFALRSAQASKSHQIIIAHIFLLRKRLLFDFDKLQWDFHGMNDMNMPLVCEYFSRSGAIALPHIPWWVNDWQSLFSLLLLSYFVLRFKHSVYIHFANIVFRTEIWRHQQFYNSVNCYWYTRVHRHQYLNVMILLISSEMGIDVVSLMG